MSVRVAPIVVLRRTVGRSLTKNENRVDTARGSVVCSVRRRESGATVRTPSGDERRPVMGPAVRRIMVPAAVMLLAGTVWAQGAKPLKNCSPDSVVSGTVCMDTYEASVWRLPNPTTTNKSLVSKIQQGKATAADLAKGGATQLGVSSADHAPCAASGQNCTDDIYAVSLPSVLPSANVTWFQAQAA